MLDSVEQPVAAVRSSASKRASLSVQRDAGDQTAPATPPETLSFTVTPPANATGPVLNLADFRAVAAALLI